MQEQTTTTEAVAFNPTPVTLGAEVKPEYNALDWVRILCSQTGVIFTEIPKELIETIKATPNKAETNKLFFSWLEARVVSKYQFSDEDRALFKRAISLESNAEYTRLISDRRNHQTTVTRKLNEIDNIAFTIANLNERIRAFTREFNVDLTPEVEAIVKDGWWKFQPVLTHEYNLNVDPRNMAFIFTTPRVNMAFYNASAGINMNVDMGMYKVLYHPRLGTIKVSSYEDNIISEGYMHPHITGTTNGSICWGNASSTYSKSMADQSPAKAMAALRVLLQTYNDESPYHPITDFALMRDPDLFKDKEIIKVDAGEAWVDDDDMPMNYDDNLVYGDNDPDEDGTHRHHVRVFREEYKGTGIQVPGTSYFMKLNDGTYAEVSIHDWY